jgi:hypothetical protein
MRDMNHVTVLWHRVEVVYTLRSLRGPGGPVCLCSCRPALPSQSRDPLAPTET